MAGLQTVGLQPTPLAVIHGVMTMPSCNKSAAFPGDSYPDTGEVGHSFLGDLLTSLEPEETPREPGREGGRRPTRNPAASPW